MRARIAVGGQSTPCRSTGRVRSRRTAGRGCRQLDTGEPIRALPKTNQWVCQLARHATADPRRHNRIAKPALGCGTGRTKTPCPQRRGRLSGRAHRFAMLEVPLKPVAQVRFTQHQSIPPPRHRSHHSPNPYASFGSSALAGSVRPPWSLVPPFAAPPQAGSWQRGRSQFNRVAKEIFSPLRSRDQSPTNILDIDAATR